MQYNKEQLIKEITEYCNENNVDASDAFSIIEWQWDRYITDYSWTLDTILTQVSDHWVILVDMWDQFYLQYQCSDIVLDKYITIVVDNSFEEYEIKSIEDIAYIIIEMEERFQNIIKFLCWNTETK